MFLPVGLSVHDRRIFEIGSLGAEIEVNLNPRHHLLGYAGYPLKRYPMTPVEFPDNAHERAHNESFPNQKQY